MSNSITLPENFSYSVKDNTVSLYYKGELFAFSYIFKDQTEEQTIGLLLDLVLDANPSMV